MPSDVAPRTDKRTCATCHGSIARGDRFVYLHIAAGVGNHPSGAGRTLFSSDVHEVAHASCADPKHRAPKNPVNTTPRQALKPQNPVPQIRPRYEDYVCAQCQKMIEVDDRFVICYISQGPGIDPETGNPGISVSSEFEVAHKNCDNPKLEKASLILGV